MIRQKPVTSPKAILGTAVKDRSGAKIGVIQEVVQEAQSNKIIFAVVGFGGFLGFGHKFHPIPWSQLDYVPGENAYVMRFATERLQAAPAGDIGDLTRDEGRTIRDRSYEYFGVSRFWQQ